MNSVEYHIAEYQDVFINSDDQQVAIIGAKGCGKTFTGARFVMKQSAEQPRSQGIVMFNTLQQARDIYYQDIEPLLIDLSWPYHFNSQTMTLTLFGMRVHFRSAEADSIKNIESVQYDWGWADEASFYNFESLQTFASRIRKGKAKIRITSMPDEPDHPLYEYLEKSGYIMYELALKDNPDREFAERYEKHLRSIYDGAQLRRFLSGERVSLAGVGLFSVTPEMKQKVSYDSQSDVLLTWDFNVEYRAVSAWQKIGKDEKARDRVACVKSWQMKQATVYEDAIELAIFFKDLQGTLWLHGDASENKKSSQTTESIWMTVRRAFKSTYENKGPDVRNVVPSRNPNVKDTIQCANWAFRQELVLFDLDEKNVYRSLQASKSDKYGEIDKSGDNRPGGAKSHEADTARYALWHFYKDLYPGGHKQIWVV